MAYTYKLTHKLSGQFYFGSRQVNVLSPKEDLPIYQSSSKIVKEIGFENFEWEILAEFDSGDDAYDYENRLIKENFRNHLILNRHYRSDGKSRFKRSGPHSNETKSKMSKSKRGKKIGPMSNDHKKKISEGLSGIKFGPMSDIQKKKISDAQKGKKKKPLSEYQKECVSKAQSGKIISENTKAKMRREVTCPHCGKTGGITAMKCWHFDNCKLYDREKTEIT